MLKEKTIELLRESPKPLPKIAKDCNLKERWLYHLKNDYWDDPGVLKIERLYEYLSGKSLNLVRKRKLRRQVSEEKNR